MRVGGSDLLAVASSHDHGDSRGDELDDLLIDRRIGGIELADVHDLHLRPAAEDEVVLAEVGPSGLQRGFGHAPEITEGFGVGKTR